MSIVTYIDGHDRLVSIRNAKLTDVLLLLPNSYINVSEQFKCIDFIGYPSIGKVWVHCHYKLVPGEHVTIEGFRVHGRAHVVFDSWALEYDNDGEPQEQGVTLNELLARMGGAS